jgi:hypothetical protein
MDTNFVEQLKQDVAKWEEAAKAIEELIPKMPQTDQADWSERAKRYKANGREIRSLIETLDKAR